MKYNKIILLLFVLVLAVFLLSGCSLLAIPGKIIDGTFSLLSGILKILNKLPKPPPGVF